ncbi:hypothetical protein Dsin_009897 [Dipteronia sinensis]|uniref:Tryptophan synthase n=1 Tax=Dipteronia sinensis TaxID=43782 RepID=A0AAE0ARQ1_9ROSI|nr:hypothetical protein Dsin_009897 [Dipteronia sinensis]
MYPLSELETGFYKFSDDREFQGEDLSHTGAHKINNPIAQALLAKPLDKQRIIAETGAGQHGVASATVCTVWYAVYYLHGCTGYGKAVT